MKRRNFVLLYGVLLLCLMTMPVLAGQSSADYEVPINGMNSGGSAQSADYVVDSVIGDIGGISAVADQTLKHGYAGQLYNATAIHLSATPDTVNEGAMRQVSATATLDDDSCLVLSNTDPTWSIGGWPLASVNGAGMVTASNVYDDVSGSVLAAYESVTGALQLLVLNTDSDNFGSYALDGLDDEWQVQYFGLDNPDAAPGADPDDDGQSNRYERIVGTDPTTNASFFAMWIERVSGVSTQVDIVFNPAFSNREYQVERAGNLIADSWTSLTEFAESTNGTERTIRDLNATSTPAFYRVLVKYPQ